MWPLLRSRGAKRVSEIRPGDLPVTCRLPDGSGIPLPDQDADPKRELQGECS